jgi:4-hydroxy-2-oxoheptanedioate aldolase
MCVASALTDPAVCELLSLLGFDCLWLDLEHHPRSTETVANLMRAARVGGADIIARPAKGELMRLGRLLEGGATGIMYPRCEHEDEAAAVVRAARFAPMGARGLDGGNADMPYCSLSLPDYIRQANARTFIFVQIEDPASLDRVEKIAAVPGIDGIFFGPGDFSVLAGIPEQFDHPMIVNAQKRIAAACASNGIRWGMPGLSMDHMRNILKMNASFIAWGTDIVVLKEGFEAIQRDLGPLGFTFQNTLASGGARPI